MGNDSSGPDPGGGGGGGGGGGHRTMYRSIWRLGGSRSMKVAIPFGGGMSEEVETMGKLHLL